MWNSRRTIVDVFATIFLLSFSKLSLTLLLPLYPSKVRNIKLTGISSTITLHSFTDAHVNFVSKEHLPFTVIAMALFIFVLIPLVLLLALYPFQWFRSLLFKCLPK